VAWDKGIGEKLGWRVTRPARQARGTFFSLGGDAAGFDPYRTVTDEEREIIITGMKDMYAQFGRRRGEEPPHGGVEGGGARAGPRVDGARRAGEGLIDRIGVSAMHRGGARAGQDRTEEEIDVVEYAPRGLFKVDLPTPSLRAPFAGLGILAMTDFGARWRERFNGDDARDGKTTRVAR